MLPFVNDLNRFLLYKAVFFLAKYRAHMEQHFYCRPVIYI